LLAWAGYDLQTTLFGIALLPVNRLASGGKRSGAQRASGPDRTGEEADFACLR